MLWANNTLELQIEVSPSTNSDHFNHTPSKNKLKAAQTLTIAFFLLSFSFISRICGSVLPNAWEAFRLPAACSLSLIKVHGYFGLGARERYAPSFNAGETEDLDMVVVLRLSHF